MTSACLRLLASAGNPIWPWVSAPTPGLLVEAFPAAQLQQWALPWSGYNGTNSSALKQRERILESLAHRIAIEASAKSQLLESADALDAVLCAFAAIAVTDGAVESGGPKDGSRQSGCRQRPSTVGQYTGTVCPAPLSCQ